MKKQENTTVTAATKSAELIALEENHGTIYTIEGKDNAGNPVFMYLKKPDYKLKKAVFVALAMAQKDTDLMAVINAGEMILLGCYVGGTNLYTDEDTRMEAALQAAEIADINDTIRLKKN